MIMTQEEFQLFNEILDSHFGLCFPESKKEILESRLKPRLDMLKMRHFMDYYFTLQYNSNGSDEISHLARLVTNNESYFFRETHQFEALFNHALDDMKKTSALPGTIRILCAGCSTGEEAYTLNIYAKENLYQMWGYAVEISAFDIDTDALQTAKEAEYGSNSFRFTDSEKLIRYFKKQNGTKHSVKETFRTGINFDWGNILKLETYKKLMPYDALFCRNVLIYFSEVSLHKAIDNFAQCLRPGGILFLGHSESIIGISDKFESIRLGNCIVYRRTNR
jgi:chemotaxis protein methyltransferase CheR